MNAPLAHLLPEPARPRTRGECQGGARPCPWVSCTEHTALALAQRMQPALSDDAIVDAIVEGRVPSCVLDVADKASGAIDRGGASYEDATLDEVGAILGVSRERVRQIGAKAMEKVVRRARHLAIYLDEEPVRVLRPARARAWVADDATTAHPAPARWTGLPGPEAVTALTDTFWCPHLAAGLSARLCIARQCATHAHRADLNPNARRRPLHPRCAECPDGAALRARVEQAPAPPSPPATATAPATRGDVAELSPALVEVLMDTDTTSTTPPPAPCGAKGCEQSAARVRRDTTEGTEDFCQRDRRLALARAQDWGLDVKVVAARMREGQHERPESDAAPRAKRKKPTKRGKPAKRTAAPATSRRKSARPRPARPVTTAEEKPLSVEALQARARELFGGVTEDRVRAIVREEFARLLGAS